MAQDRHLTTEQLSAYLDKQLSAQEQAAFDAHLQSCQQCQNVLDDLRQTVALLHALPQPALPRSFVLPAEVLQPAAPAAATRTSTPAPLHIDEGRRRVERRTQERSQLRKHAFRRTLRAMSTIAAVIGFIFLLSAIPLHVGGGASSATSGGASVPGSAPASGSSASGLAQTPSVGPHTGTGRTPLATPAKGTQSNVPTPVPTSQPQDRNHQAAQQPSPAPASTLLQIIGSTLDPTAPGGRALDGLLLLALAILGFVLARIWRSAKATA